MSFPYMCVFMWGEGVGGVSSGFVLRACVCLTACCLLDPWQMEKGGGLLRCFVCVCVFACLNLCD